MKPRPFSKSWFAPIVSYSMIVWTVICFIGTWYVILKYDILMKGLIGLGVTLLFAAAIWAIPFGTLILFSLYVNPEGQEEVPMRP